MKRIFDFIVYGLAFSASVLAVWEIVKPGTLQHLVELLKSAP